MAGVSQASQGRRGYYLYEYGTHLWFPQTLTDFSAGMFRDVARSAIPANGVYDACDFFLDRPGVAYKRGGTQFTGAAVTSIYSTVSYLAGIAAAQFPVTTAGTTRFTQQVIAITDQGDITGNIFQVTGTALVPGVVPKDKPSLFIGGTKNYLIITDSTGTLPPYFYDGTVCRPLGSFTQTLTITGTPSGGTITVSALRNVDSASIAFNSSNASAKTALDGMAGILATFTVTGGTLPGTPLVITPSDFQVLLSLESGYNHLTGGSSPAATIVTASTDNVPTARYSTIHLSRVVLASTPANPNRIWFSPILDPNGTWDSTAWVDADNAITGIAVVGGQLLVFGRQSLEKYVGDTPPPGSNFTHVTVDSVGCTDARSITVSEGACYFANPAGVYRTDGTSVVSLTEGRIGSFWRSSLAAGNYVADTCTIATGIYARRYLYVTVLNASRAIILNLMCDLKSSAWWRVSGNPVTMYATGFGVGGAAAATEELFGSSSSVGAGLVYSTMFSTPSAQDADSTEIAPILEPRPFGANPGMTAFGKGHITYDMRHGDVTSHLAVTVAPGIEATTYAAVPESPLSETTDATRARYSTGKRAQALNVKLVQANGSIKTEIYSVEQDTRGFPKEVGGQ